MKVDTDTRIIAIFLIYFFFTVSYDTNDKESNPIRVMRVTYLKNVDIPDKQAVTDAVFDPCHPCYSVGTSAKVQPLYLITR